MTASPNPPLFFSVVIVSLNGAPVLGRALEALRATRWPRFETIVVDNGSSDETAEIVRGFPEVRLIQSPVNLGFAGGNNLGIREAHGDVVVLLNDDTEPDPDWLAAWARAAAANPAWGVLGCKLLYPDGVTVQHAGGVVEPNGFTHHLGYEKPDDGRWDDLVACDYVTGAATAIRREVIDVLGGLDEGYWPIYFEECDYCWQVRRIGYEVLYVPEARVLHHESRTQVRYSFKFIYRYTRCRMRFLVKCFSKEQLLRAAAVELRWWFKPFSYHCYWPFFRGYLHALPRLPFYLRERFAFHRRLRAISNRLRPRLDPLRRESGRS